MPRSFRPIIILPVTTVLLTVGCAAPGNFPSLAVREAEFGRSTEEPVREATVIPSNLRLLASIAALLTQVREGQRSFETALPAARAAVSRAGAAQSDSWVEAQQAVSRLEAARTASVIALFDLDQLAIARAAAPTNADDFAILMAAVEEAAAVARRQWGEMERLQRTLRSA